MLQLKRILLIAPSEMTRPGLWPGSVAGPCNGALLHIVAFDEVTPLEQAGLFDQDALAQARGVTCRSTATG
jgi:hypothetical protein